MLMPIARLLRKPPRNHSRTSSLLGAAMRAEPEVGTVERTAAAADVDFIASSNDRFWSAISASSADTSSRIASWRSSLADLYSSRSDAASATFSVIFIAFFSPRVAANVPLYAAFSTSETSCNLARVTVREVVPSQVSFSTTNPIDISDTTPRLTRSRISVARCVEPRSATNAIPFSSGVIVSVPLFSFARGSVWSCIHHSETDPSGTSDPRASRSRNVRPRSEIGFDQVSHRAA